VRLGISRASGGTITRASGRSLNLPSYITVSKFFGLTGDYQYKIRNCTPGFVTDVTGNVNSSQRILQTFAPTGPSIGYIELAAASETMESPSLYPTQAYKIIPIADSTGTCTFDYMSALYEQEPFDINNQNAYSYLYDYAVCSHGLLGVQERGSLFLTNTPCTQ